MLTTEVPKIRIIAMFVSAPGRGVRLYDVSPIGVLWSEGNQGGNKYLPLVIQQRLPSLPNREGGDSIVTLSHKETRERLDRGRKG